MKVEKVKDTVEIQPAAAAIPREEPDVAELTTASDTDLIRMKQSSKSKLLTATQV